MCNVLSRMHFPHTHIHCCKEHLKHTWITTSIFQTVSQKTIIFFLQYITQGRKDLRGVSCVSLMGNVLIVWINKHISISSKIISNLNSLQKQFSDWFSAKLICLKPNPSLFFERERKASKARLGARYWWHSKRSSQPRPQKIWERCICIRSVLGFWWKLCSIPLPLSLSNTPALLVHALN